MTKKTFRSGFKDEKSKVKNLKQIGMNKKHTLIFIALLMFSKTFSQDNEKYKFYLSGELFYGNFIHSSSILGNFFGTDLNINLITKKDYTIKVGFIWTVRDDPALPNDFYKFNNDDFWDGFWLDYEKSYNYNLLSLTV